MSETMWDASYPPSVFAPPAVPPTGVTAGAPGAFQPGNAKVPTSIAELRADPVIGDAGTNKPGAAWAEGQFVVLDNGSSSRAHWDGTTWATGVAPAAAPPPEPEPEESEPDVEPEEEADA
jgi:hypothetical protein